MRKIKICMSAIFIIFSLGMVKAHSDAIMGAVIAGSIASAEASTSNVVVSKKFNSIFICNAQYRKIDNDNYEYYCPHPPHQSNVSFMSTTFDEGGWPEHIIYYMRSNPI